VKNRKSGRKESKEWKNKESRIKRVEVSSKGLNRNSKANQKEEGT
jgi:hypothetical protein